MMHLRHTIASNVARFSFPIRLIILSTAWKAINSFVWVPNAFILKMLILLIASLFLQYKRISIYIQQFMPFCLSSRLHVTGMEKLYLREFREDSPVYASQYWARRTSRSTAVGEDGGGGKKTQKQKRWGKIYRAYKIHFTQTNKHTQASFIRLRLKRRNIFCP